MPYQLLILVESCSLQITIAVSKQPLKLFSLYQPNCQTIWLVSFVNCRSDVTSHERHRDIEDRCSDVTSRERHHDVSCLENVTMASFQDIATYNVTSQERHYDVTSINVAMASFQGITVAVIIFCEKFKMQFQIWIFLFRLNLWKKFLFNPNRILEPRWSLRETSKRRKIEFGKYRFGWKDRRT